MNRTIHVPPFLEAAACAREYRDIGAALRSPDLVTFRPNTTVFTHGSLVQLDGPPHHERRRLESQMFAAQALAAYERVTLGPLLDKFMAECKQDRGADGTVRLDLVDVALAMLVRIGASIADIDAVETPEDGMRLLAVIDTLNAAANAHWTRLDETGQQALIDQGIAAQRSLRDDFYAPSAARRQVLVEAYRRGELDERDLPRDVITMLLLHVDGALEDELPLREAMVFLIASVRTTTRALCNTLQELFEWFEAHPEDRAKVHDEAFRRKAIEESLRLHPVLPAIVRKAAEDVELPSGTVLPAGEVVGILFAQANRDREIFGDDADEFDLHRVLPQGVRTYGMAFGSGAHTCIGRRLAIGGSGAGPEEPATAGTLATLLERLFAVGVEPDPDEEPVRTDGYYDEYVRYPVRLTNP